MPRVSVTPLDIIEITKADDPIGLSSVTDMIYDGFRKEALDRPGAERVPWCLAVKDGDKILAGCQGHSGGVNIYIKYLFVDKTLREQGYGARLMNRVEDIAKERGAHKLWVDTMSYQAPEFYKKLGYEEVSRVDGFGGDCDRVFFCKILNA
jgi:GNAT superfamily N-acetyltransferase